MACGASALGWDIVLILPRAHRVFSHQSRFKIAMTNCNCDIWITECTHERENTFPSLGCSIPERGEEAWLVFVFFWHAHAYIISIWKCAVNRRKWLEGHVAPSPKSQCRGQGIHTAILLRDLRDASPENTSWRSLELHNSNYATLRTHRPKYRHSNDP